MTDECCRKGSVVMKRRVQPQRSPSALERKTEKTITEILEPAEEAEPAASKAPMRSALSDAALTVLRPHLLKA